MNRAMNRVASWTVMLASMTVLAGCTEGDDEDEPAPTYTVGGSITGLGSSGLVLQVNGGNNVTVASGATSFATGNILLSGASYGVTVLTQPANHMCAVASGAGMVGNANVTSVVVTCTPIPTYTIGGSVTGLGSAGLVLQINGNSSANITVASGATTFASGSLYRTGQAYTVTVLTQSANETCTIANGTGTVASANITNVTINCVVAPRFTLSGTVSGLAADGLVLQINGANNFSVANGATTFGPVGSLRAGAAYTYAVTVLNQPTNQSCIVTNGTGTMPAANVTNIAINCASDYLVGVTVTGLAGTGLVLQLNGANNLSPGITSGLQNFNARLATGAAYAVTVLTQPTSPNQRCTVTNGSGTIGTAHVTDVTVACVNTFAVNGNVSGLTGTLGLAVGSAAGSIPITVNAGATTFTTGPVLTTTVGVAISSQPTGQTCLVSNGSVLPRNPPVDVTVTVTCVANTTSQLVGMYSAEFNGAYGVVLFYADGRYVFALRHSPTNNCSNGAAVVANSIEYGTYSWNSTTGAFRILNAPVDTDNCGFNDLLDPRANFVSNLVKSAGALTFTWTEGGVARTFTLTAVPSTPTSLIGGFSLQQVGSSMVFFNDGTYMQINTQSPAIGSVPGYQAGFEHGCYTSTANTVAFDNSATCRPTARAAVDTNGGIGFAPRFLNTPIAYSIVNEELTIGGTLIGPRINVN